MVWRASEAELVWHGERPADVEERVREDLKDELSDLKKAGDLVFHTVFLGDDLETCATVVVYGVRGSDALHCQYHEDAEWETLSDLREVPFA